MEEAPRATRARRRRRRDPARPPLPPPLPRHRGLNPWLRARYGARVHKVSLKADFTCPNRDGTAGRGGCTFCSLAALEPVGYDPAQDVATQLAEGMRYVAERHGASRFLAYFQDYSATYDTPERLRRIYEPAIAPPEVVGLALGTRPDCLPEPVLDLLAELNQRTDVIVELGLQVADDGALRRLNRCHTVEDFARAVEACHARGLPVCAHAILGLPFVDPELERGTARLFADLGVWGAKVHALHVIAGTRLGKELQQGELGPLLTLEDYARRAADFVELLDPASVVHRLSGEAPRRLTLAPSWTINKLAVQQAVLNELEARDGWQGRQRGAPREALAAEPGAWGPALAPGREAGHTRPPGGGEAP